jgi:hypothetical protein
MTPSSRLPHASHTSLPSASTPEPILKHFLSSEMESLSWCREHGKKVLAALKRIRADDPHSMAGCRKGGRCHDGRCPVCIRILRRKLLLFAIRSELHRLRWYFVTIFIEGWIVPPGDTSPFGKLRDHLLIENFKRQLRRKVGPDLIVIGSIETEYRLLDNEPRGKPFHLHLMISGTSEETIKKAARTCFPADPAVVESVRADPVLGNVEDFLWALSYAFKQPFWKKSKRRGMTKAPRQWPKPAELAELVSNLGVHGWTGRLILVGIRFEGGEFRRTTNLSSTSSCDGERHPHETARRCSRNPDPRGERRRE